MSEHEEQATKEPEAPKRLDPSLGSIRVVRVVHARFETIWGPLPQVAPGVHFRVAEGEEIPNVLAFRDADGETHMYVVDEQVRKAIVETLSGGIVLADRIPT